MNADKGRMNADKAMNGLRAKFARYRQVHETFSGVFIRVHLAFICVHLRSLP
jgi:hypothetical protein